MPLSFIGQVNLAEVSAVASDRGLPQAGLLLFFWDAADPAWGLDPSEADRFRVVYVPEGEALERAEPPATLVPPHKYARVVFAPVRVAPRIEITLPFPRTEAARNLVRSDDEMERYFDEVWAKTSEVVPGGQGPLHRMFGAPRCDPGRHDSADRVRVCGEVRRDRR